MLKTLNRSLFFMITGLALYACVEQVNIEDYLKSEPSATLVVEGLITDELKQHIVKLTRSGKALPDDHYESVSGAEVTIGDGVNIYLLSEDKEMPGVYLTDSIKGEVGKTYTLIAKVNDDEVYEASDRMVEVLNFGPTEGIRLGSNNPPNGYIQTPLIVFGSNAPSMVTIIIDNPFPSDKYTHLDYYAFPGVDPDNILPKVVEASLSYTKGTQLTQTKYSLSPEYYLFLRALLLETEYKGGIFGSVRSNVPTNVSNSGYGFFGASSVIKRTGTFDEQGRLNKL